MKSSACWANANHGFSTYINVHAALHWLIPNALIAEFVVQENTGLRERLTKHHVRMKDGFLPMPDAPGRGLELNEEQVRKHR